MHLPLTALGPDSSHRLGGLIARDLVRGLGSLLGSPRRADVGATRGDFAARAAQRNGFVRVAAGMKVGAGAIPGVFTGAEAAAMGRGLIERVCGAGRVGLAAAAAEAGLTVNEARMAIRIAVCDERGDVPAGCDIRRAEEVCGLRDDSGRIVSDFR